MGKARRVASNTAWCGTLGHSKEHSKCQKGGVSSGYMVSLLAFGSILCIFSGKLGTWRLTLSFCLGRHDLVGWSVG